MPCPRQKQKEENKMLISLPRSRFSDQLQVVSKTVPPKSTIPYLEGIYFELRTRGRGSAQITVSGANIEMVVSALSLYDIPVAKETCDFALVLPVRIQEIVRRLPGETVQLLFDRENFSVTVSSQDPDVKSESEFHVYGFDPQDFPKTPAFAEPEVCFSPKAADLRNCLRQILFAVSADESKPAFTGVHFKLEGEKLTLSSSDTFRVATTNCPLSGSGSRETGSVSFLAPGRLMQECIRTLGDSGRLQPEQKVTFKLEKNRLLLESLSVGQSGLEVKIFSRLLDENYPDVERVLPREFAGTHVIATRELAASLERALVLTETGSPVLKFTFEKDLLTIRAQSRYGKVQEKVGAQGEGADLEISFNARFLLDMLKVCEGEEAVVRHTGPNRGVLLKDSLYEEYRYFLLPVKN